MTTPHLTAGFSRFLGADPERLHVAAHSHHPWPDVTLAAQLDAWHDAATMMDRKWIHVFDDVLPETRRWIAHRLGLPDPADVVIAPNTHELVMRILSCLDAPVRILTTAGEFISFERQVRRLAEDGLVQVRRIAVTPAATLTTRLADAAAAGDYDLLFFSHVLFESGVVVDLPTVVDAVPDRRPFVVIDGYHGFMAVPTDLSTVADRVFYLAGGYKYAMAGEGACFAHCPPGYGPRPRDTGWFADFSALGASADARITYADAGQRFMGATFDPTALYRFNAVQRWLDAEGVVVDAIHDHVRRLQDRFLAALADARPTTLGTRAPVVVPSGRRRHGHLLAFDVPHAAEVTAALARRNVVADHRGSRVRIGFGVYHEDRDLDRLLDRL
ncbi:MAG: aminotransferase class V-fold PLP-dependent enzyme [Actinobacteria bacterium]|nr:aminotransferase class V-fold PLP-dependent enzyme [Actinomycetota bacterium]